ncbi:MAG: glycoside hydrolase family 2 protein [Lachnospiraceae bacterium]|nr:glycoside hydrolase family 2 protein [Lachnospiraceae bacterium]
MSRIYIDREWKFDETFSTDMVGVAYDESSMKNVEIPHNVKEMPFHYFDESIYQMECCYRRHIVVKDEWKDKVILLTFEGVAHECDVYVNGNRVCGHSCGYTAFTADISRYLEYGRDNVIAVRVDSREDLDQPPFGFAIDYMTYGGIYRDVYLDIKSPSYISRTAISTKLIDRYEKDGRNFCKKGAAITKVYTNGPTEGLKILSYIRRKDGGDFTKTSETLVTEGYTEVIARADDVRLWDVTDPALYEQKLELVDAAGSVMDEHTDTFGFRKAVFKTNGFFLNGRKLKIRGLNRHQSYAYTGYAMPGSMQRLDAKILKEELGVNAVRTSHYPQDQSFLDECDRLGLLVFTEIPGWQHIGGPEWKDKAVDNVRDMIRQNINHPSIILWGVRINESVDDEEFYARTNKMAHAEDPDRQTGGVRCYKKGIFQEDVFTYNDFSHSGANAGVDKKESVTTDPGKPYLVTEYNGHMFPTKSFDPEAHRTQHMLRHARVLNDVAAADDISGSFGWCMFDYNTHKDFGSGDRICYHGVCDMFRNPKLAAYVYMAQQDNTPVLAVSSAMNIGEHPGGVTGDIYIITNADSVKMYKNDELIKEYTDRDSVFRDLKHGPIIINDRIGNALEVHEGMPPKKAKEIKDLLNAVAKRGLYDLSVPFMAKAGMIAAKYRMKISDAVELYNKYVGNWGGKVSSYRFEAIKDGKIVKELVISTSSKMQLNVKANTDTLHTGKTYDVALVRINAVDENGNLLNFCNDPVSFKTEGAIELIGPDVVSLSGGMGGVYVRSRGAGAGVLMITDSRGTVTKIGFNVTDDEDR